MTANARFGIDGHAFAETDSARALGPQHWARLCALDQSASGQNNRATASTLPIGPADEAAQVDIAIAGGGLSVLLAPLLARRGHRVAVVDQAPIGHAHREWNASAQELDALLQVGLLAPDELQALIVARYKTGSCRWFGHGTTHVQGVLDCAVDAGALLLCARQKAQAANVRLFDRTRVVQTRADEQGVSLLLHTEREAMTLRARVMIDARGVQSPYARPDLACPTVGGVFADAAMGDAPDQYRPDIGEILASTEDVEGGRQHLWEAFPGRAGELTIYLFAYVRRQALGDRPLARLYERFWRTLPRFKQGRVRLLRPTYGIIPGWSRLTPGARAPHRRVLLVGDAAARHSPLTYCGFGATLRSLAHTVHAAERVLAAPQQTPPPAVDDAPLHSATGLLAALMAQPPRPASALNALLATSFSTLEQMGNPAFAALLQDRMAPREVARFLWRVSKQHPRVWGDVTRLLGPKAAIAWSSRLAWHSLRAP